MEWVKLCDVAEVIMGQSPKSEYCNDNKEGLPFYQGVSDFGEIFPVPAKYCTEPKKMAEIDDILIGVRAPVGDLNISNSKCCIGRGVAAIRANEKFISKKYLFYFLKTQKQYFEINSTGSTFKAINKSVLSETLVPIIGINKQKIIEHILDRIENIIRKRKEQILSYDDLIESLLKNILNNPNNNKVDLEKFLEDITAGKSLAGKEKSNFKVLKTSCVFTGHFDENEWKYLPKDYIPQEKHIIKEGDILVSRMNTSELVGASVYVYKDYEDLTVPDRLWILKLKNNISGIYLWKFFQTNFYRNQIQNISTGTSGSMKNISQKNFRKLEIIYPPIELQNKFADYVIKIEEEKKKLNSSLKELEDLFDALMQEAFSGNLFKD